MNRTDLYRLLPNPDEVGQSEYRTLHNLLVDSINEWISSENEDIREFSVSVLTELAGWTQFVLTLIENDKATSS